MFSAHSLRFATAGGERQLNSGLLVGTRAEAPVTCPSKTSPPPQRETPSSNSLRDDKVSPSHSGLATGSQKPERAFWVQEIQDREGFIEVTGGRRVGPECCIC